MQIDTSRKPKSYLNPKDQRRLFALFGVLILVLIAARVAANPANWQWMFAGAKGNQETPADPQNAAETDTTTTQLSTPLKQGEFRSSRDDSGQPREKTAETRPGVKQVAEPDGTTVIKYGPGPNIDPESVEVHASLLKSVEDRSWNVRPEEAGVYFSILKHARRVSQRDLQRVGRDHVALSVLMSSPAEYRGAAITVDGLLYRIRRLPGTLPEDKAGADSSAESTPLFDAWIRPPGSLKTPYRVVLSELPAGVDNVERSREFEPAVPVRASGYFFKVQKYEIDADRDGFAPLILAKRIRILKEPASSSRTISAAPYIVGFICFVLAALAFAIWRFSIGDKAFHKKHLERISEPSTAEKLALNNLPAEEPADMFANLAEADQTNAGDR